MMGYNGYGMSGWMWVWGAALIIVVLVLVGGLVWAMVATTANRRPSADDRPMDGARPTSDSSARQILDERYARGELDTEEYRERLQTLGG
jgi:putative membrane protein